MYEIRKIKKSEVNAALALAWDVFMEFEAPDYPPEGVETFRGLLADPTFIARCESGECPIYAAFDGDTIVGIWGLKENRTHVILVFTKASYHHQGIATAIFRYMLDDLRRENPSLKELTLNASPYGLGFYQHLGFEPTSEQRQDDGIIYTPMRYRFE